MLPNITLKSAGIGAALLTGITATTVGVGYGTGLFTASEQKPQTHKLTKLLDEENKYALLSRAWNADTQGWKDAWKAYKENGQNKWNIQGLEETNLDQVPQGFKIACTNRKTNEATDINDSEYTDFVNYCTRAKTVQEALGKFGFKPLGLERNDVWSSIFSGYGGSQNQLPNAKITSSVTYEYLKKGCEVALQKKTTDNDYEATAEAAKEWCRQR